MMLHFLNDVAKPLNQQNKKYIIIASSNSETMDKLINRFQYTFSSFDIKFTRLDFENAC